MLVGFSNARLPKTRQGRSILETLPRQQMPPDIFAQQQMSVELRKRIRKLGWIGMEDEAKRLEVRLRRKSYAGSVLAAHHDDTD